LALSLRHFGHAQFFSLFPFLLLPPFLGGTDGGFFFFFLAFLHAQLYRYWKDMIPPIFFASPPRDLLSKETVFSLLVSVLLRGLLPVLSFILFRSLARSTQRFWCSRANFAFLVWFISTSVLYPERRFYPVAQSDPPCSFCPLRSEDFPERNFSPLWR